MVQFAICTGTAAATNGGNILVTITVETGEVHEFTMTTTAATALHAALEAAGIGE
jgi:hypothetical protein